MLFFDSTQVIIISFQEVIIGHCLFWILQVVALNFGDFYNVQYVKMYNIFMMQLQVCLSIITSTYLSANECLTNKFCRYIVKFISIHYFIV